ncbi:MAG: exodeoxyribonuclease VII small subunit [Pontiellaceae bacterium]|tara:strand:- start:274 stop:504 length:231 start_codon:yes stop_codon:yes gene_type:complete
MAEKKESFEKSLERLEEVVEQMESGKLDLEEMIKRFEEGTKLVDRCSSKLNQVEQKIEKLIKSKDVIKEEPFENNE